MKKNVSRRHVYIPLLAAAMFYSGLAWGQGLGLPEGKGRDTVMQVCTACHGLDHITNPHKKLTAEEWEFYLYEMISRGAPLHKEDMNIVKNYLIDNFAVKNK
jgi:hypothetical protein